MEDLKAVIFDWGDTVMRDFPRYKGPMAAWPRVEAMPGVAAALHELQGRYLCCLASNAGVSDAYLMGRALTRVNLRRHFQALYTARELGRVKPDPAFFLEISTRLGLRPDECVAVGNDYAKDILPAKAAGLRTVWYCPRSSHVEPNEADAVIDDLGHLVQTVAALGANHAGSS